ncbi:MAG: tetratricopeptide repeat protein [Planctomycetaceae bacterium]|nr:tetratricopeptide repeat protein [Planctomycetaceae bacterium]
MKSLVTAAALVACLGLVGDASAIDAVRKVGNQRVSGTVKSVGATEVMVDAQGTPTKVPVNEIESIQFDGEPSEMNLVRSAMKSGSYQSALTQLKKINPTTVTRKEVKQDYEFYAALAQAKLALLGSGRVDEAGTAIFNFVTNNKDSYHYYQAVETMGDLLVGLNKVDDALKYYSELEATPFDDLKMRAGVARGKALMQQQKFPEAQAAFEAVLKLPFNPMTQKGTPAESQRFAAVLGRTQCQASTQQYDEAIKELEGNVIANLNPEESELQAKAYVTLGNCYNAKPDGKKAALLAFLHVDVLYASVPDAHAEALWNLSNLWNDLGKNERGQECLNRLNRLYPGSPWITKKRPV